MASWRIARRDLHASFRGLRLLFVCLFLGVCTLAAIGSLTASITGELMARGQVMLGGDVEVAMTQREASPAELAAIGQAGAVSETIRMRAMAKHAGDLSGNRPQAVLSELKAVDRAYPLYGTLDLRSGRYEGDLAPDEILIGAALADRLEIDVGEELRYGEAKFRVRDIVASEPDRIGEGFTLGPVAIVSIDGLRRTGLIQPGSLYESKYRIRLDAGSDPTSPIETLQNQFPSSSWEFRDRDRASPGASRFFERMGQFLSLIALAALVIAGIGVGNGVFSYLDRKRASIATLKVLGAASADIGLIYALQIGAVALAAITAGLFAGAALTPILAAAMGDLLPVAPESFLHAGPLAASAAYGLLIATIFVLPPLARARTEPAAALFRSMVERRAKFDARSWLGVGIATGAVIALALITARDASFALMVIGAIGAALLLLTGLGYAVRRCAALLPRPKNSLLRLTLANIHRPGSQAPALIIALGLALTLFVTLAAVQTSLSNELRNTVPEQAPDLFVLDIPIGERDRYEAILADHAPAAAINVVPNLRGTIIAFGGQRVADLEELPEGAWFLRGERGITYADALPEGSDLTQGKWWPQGYDGQPLVSLDEEAAEIMGLGIGDQLTISILGREIQTRIASLRQVNWDTMGFNYIMVVSPNTVRGAPHNLVSTITLDGNETAELQRALLAEFPSVSIIEVSEVVDQITQLLRQMTAAILAAASVTVIAGIAVLIGAIAATNQARAYDSVIMRTLGATRRQILLVQTLEYALIAAVLAAVALAIGIAAGWSVIVQIFEFSWTPDLSVVLATLAAGTLLTFGIGLASAIPLLSIRPAHALRQL